MKPKDHSRHVDGAKEIASGLVIVSGNSPIWLEASKEIFNPMPSLVEMTAILTWFVSICAALCNHDTFVCCQIPDDS